MVVWLEVNKLLIGIVIVLDFTKISHILSAFVHYSSLMERCTDGDRRWKDFHFADKKGHDILSQPDLLEVIPLRRQCWDMNPFLVSEMCVLPIATPLSHQKTSKLGGSWIEFTLLLVYGPSSVRAPE